MGRTRIDQISDAEKARFNEWADRWIEVGLRTGPADRERFVAAVRDCYRFAGIPFPEVVVWVPSPLVLAFAAPAAALAIELIEAGRRREGTKGRRRHGAVGDAVDDAVGVAVDGAVRGAEIRRAVLDAIRRGWSSYMGGQLWVGGWYYGGAWNSFFREIMDLELSGDLWDRARAYEATMESACWWWPHRRFVMVCERPLAIHRERARPDVTRGWGSHRLHCETGPAVVWPDGWGLHVVHGVRVPAQVVEAPETLTVQQIIAEQNAEVRRVMLDRFGAENFIRTAGAKRVQADDYGALYRVELAGDEPLVMVQLENSTAEPDGSFKEYWLRVPPTMTSAREAVAWTFGIEKAEHYGPAVET